MIRTVTVTAEDHYSLICGRYENRRVITSKDLMTQPTRMDG